MFDGSLIESRGLIVSKTQKWTTLGSLTFQLALAGLLLAIPLMRPEALRVMLAPPRMMVPVLSRPPVQVQHVSTAATNRSALSAPSAPVVEQTRRLLFPSPGTGADANTPVVAADLPWGSGGLSPLEAFRQGTASEERCLCHLSSNSAPQPYARAILPRPQPWRARRSSALWPVWPVYRCSKC